MVLCSEFFTLIILIFGFEGWQLWNINESLKEHQSDIKNSKSNAAIARLALNQNIKIDFNNTKKLSNYNNRTYGYCHETIEIKNNSVTCNDAEHLSLDQEWQHIISKKSMRRGKEGE